MTSNETTNQLLTPILNNNNKVSNIRTDTKLSTSYFELKDFRRKARDIERHNQSSHEYQSPNPCWLKVKERSLMILTQHSKDLEVACWLTEALTRLEQAPGLCLGITLLTKLCEQQCSSIQPSISDDDYSKRLAPIISLNGDGRDGTLIEPIAALRITNSNDNNYAKWQYQQALENKDNMTLNTINNAVRQTPPLFYRRLTQEMDATIQQYGQLCSTLQSQCPGMDIPTSNIKNALDDFNRHLVMLLKENNINLTDKQADSNSKTNTSVTHTYKQVDSRQQALDQLLMIAHFFSSSEPHSPIPFLLRRAVKWGNLPLPELLNELVDDETTRHNIFNLTGIEPQTT